MSGMSSQSVPSKGFKGCKICRQWDEYKKDSWQGLAIILTRGRMGLFGSEDGPECLTAKKQPANSNAVNRINYWHYVRIWKQVKSGFYLWVLHPVLGTTGRSTDVRHITSLRLVVYVQRIRCIKDSPWKYLIVYLIWRWPVGAETCSEWEGK
jgi:hypothetical protein